MKAATHRRIERFVSSKIFAQCEKKLQTVERACKKKYPRILEQLRGIADGANVDYRHLLLLNAAELREGVGGCTDIAEVRKDHISLSHNEDTGEGQDTRDNCALVTFHMPHITFTSFVYAGEPGGDAYNWNSHGFFFGVNYLVPFKGKVALNRTPRDFTARALIEAKSISDALRILRSSPDASGYHYFMGQGKRLVSVEQWRGTINVKEVKGVEVHANHYLRVKKNAPTEKSTSFRQKRAEQLVRQGVNGLNILTDRANAPYTICRLSKDNGLTLSTVQFLPLQKKVRIYTPGTLKQEYSFKL